MDSLEERSSPRFYTSNNEEEDSDHGGYGRRSGCSVWSIQIVRDGQWGQSRGRGNIGSNITCHNCGKLGHIERNCWSVGGGAHGENANEENNATDSLGVNNQAICCPPRANESRERTLPDGATVNWCSLWGSQGDYFRAQHPAKAAPRVEVINSNPNNEGGYVADGAADKSNGTDTSSPMPTGEGVMVMLRATGLIWYCRFQSRVKPLYAVDGKKISIYSLDLRRHTGGCSEIFLWNMCSVLMSSFKLTSSFKLIWSALFP